MSSNADGKEAGVPFEVVHDIYEVLNLYPSGTALRDRLELYRERLRQLGRPAAEIDARLEKAQPVIEAALRHRECGSETSGKAELDVMVTTQQPEGTGWEPWTAANAPEAALWVNEERREIAIIEGGAERRIGAPDATSFALEVAELERYYDAAPRSSGARDACAMLIPRPIGAEPSVAAGLAWMIGTAVCLAVVVMLTRSAANAWDELARGGGSRFPGRDAERGSRVGAAAAWNKWAEKNGSVQLRDAIDAQVPTQELYERDIARAITPELAGAVKCRGDVSYDTALEIEYDRARRIFVEARTAAEHQAAQFPAGTTIRVEPPIGCRGPGEWAGACVPVKLVGGGYFVHTCYRLDTGLAQ